jgi:Zn-dependent peptidase ImmA (M78 family)
VKEDKPTIHVATGESEFRQRFSIAHEIAHLLLHPLNGGVVYRDKTFDGSAQETEANTFAADLLMPIWMLDPYVMQFGADIPKLSSLFQVSEAAMKVRLQAWLGR